MPLVVVGLLVACGNGSPGGSAPPSFSEVVENAEAYDGKTVRMDAAYYSSFEISVIASGLTETDPPQPVQPLVWVGTAPGDECLEQSEGSAWADTVEASGTFRYDPERGFGHLGDYEMVIEDAKLLCVREAPVSSIFLDR